MGSGFIVREDGWIVTNAHVIKNTKNISVKLRNNKVYPRAQVLYYDLNRDIALIKINAEHLKSIKLGNSNKAHIGQRVVTIGNPLGLESTVSDGLVSAIRTDEQGDSLLQVSVPLSNGSSGGPLFNLKGEVIGVVAASLQKGQSLNFAVPINVVKPRLRRFIALEEEPKPEPAVTVVKKIEPPEPKKVEKKYVEKKKAESKPPSHVYVVQPNDTLWGLARKFDTSVDAIMKTNQLKSSKIIIGQKIKIP